MWHHALWPNLAWWAAQAPGYWLFRKALSDPVRTQEGILRRILRANARSAFGLAHNFSQISSVKEFQERVPLSSYEDYEPSITRICSGEQDVLTTDPVKRLMPTSGSSAGAKLIPYTASLQQEFGAAIAPWVYDLFRSDPSLMAGPAFWSITPAMAPLGVRSAVPIGYDADTEYLGGVWKHLVDAALAVPGWVSRIADADQFRMATLAALLAAKELRLISVWHPSFLLLLLDYIATHWTQLLETLKDAERRRHLRACGPFDYRAIWPNLRLISCWADGPATVSADVLRRTFPDIKVQRKSLLATEAFVSIPLEGKYPLAIRSHFLEFIAQNGSVILAQDLKSGEEYSVVVTTSGGLYRYRLRDRVRAGELVERTPSIEFVGKEDGVADFFGEKLSDAFVAKVLQQCLSGLPCAVSFAMVLPQLSTGRAHYTLFLECDGNIPGHMAEQLQTALCQNPHYKLCVTLGQLGPVCIEQIPPGAFERYAAWKQSKGARLGNIKPVSLLADEELAGELRKRESGFP